MFHVKQSGKKKYYVVKRGKQPGVYYNWPDCQKQVQGFAGAVFKGFVTKEEAEAWYGKSIVEAPKERPPVSCGTGISIADAEKIYPPHMKPMNDSILSYDGIQMRMVLPETVVVFTDGSCLVNPNGPGGFAAVFLNEEGNQELLRVTGGEPSSTNNRMELRAAYEALKVLHDGVSRRIVFHTDSKYLQRAFMNHWIDKWKRNGWKTSQGTSVLNKDLWMGLLSLMEKHHITFEWVKGHVGTKYNEICDQLAKKDAFRFKR